LGWRHVSLGNKTMNLVKVWMVSVNWVRIRTMSAKRRLKGVELNVFDLFGAGINPDNKF